MTRAQSALFAVTEQRDALEAQLAAVTGKVTDEEWREQFGETDDGDPCWGDRKGVNKILARRTQSRQG